ncbi:MAG TPA: CinA family nicotinamide mononucleotide deamidase-related protein [Gaiellaceae bacterium]|nr:CinA family nicotinamide mononucleotide deamidase-related protein [Gaiellaceae bacterium]
MTASPRPRAAIVVTGSELVRGDRQDLNGPFLARSLLSLGIEPAQIRIVGDAAEELEAALRSGLEHELCVVSGGLGPTHDDRTVELLARAAGLALVTDEALRTRIEAISRVFAERMRRPYADFAEGVRKQATLPQGATAVDLAGTAPALVLRVGETVAVTLPGPPRELQTLWPKVLATDELRAVLARATPPQRRVLRFFGASESAVARALDGAGGDGDGVEATICARDFEIHVDLVAEAGAEARADELEARLVEPVEQYLFTRGELSIEEIVLARCRERGLTLATAESCTGGMIAARLTSVPGSSEVFLGAVVSYADEVKAAQLGVPETVLETHGAVSAETAAAMARGARERLGADVAVAVTGIAGPGGGSEAKPVGLVHVHASAPWGDRPLELTLPGDRATIRGRATVVALHLVRRLVTQS